MWPQPPTEAAGMMLLYLRGTSSLPPLFLDRFPEPRRVRFAVSQGPPGALAKHRENDDRGMIDRRRLQAHAASRWFESNELTQWLFLRKYSRASPQRT